MKGHWREALGEPGIRSLLLGWFLSLVSTYSLTVAVLVYAYEQGGASLVAIYGIASTAPGAVLTPLLMSLSAATRSDRALLLTTSCRTLLTAGAALAVLLELPPWLVLTFAAAASSLGSTFRPTQATLLPWLARTPGELTAGNVGATVAENTAGLLGPVLAGVLLAVSDESATMAVATVAMFLATLSLRALDVPQESRGRTGSVRVAGLVREVGTGAVALVRVAPPAGIVVLALAQTFVRGALVVLMTVLALDTLQLGESAVGWLTAAIGLGGLVGAGVAARTVRLNRLGRCFIAALVLWGVGVLALGGAPTWWMAFAALAIVGVGNAVEDASAFTLLPRLLGPRLAAPALGAFELVVLAGMGSGALLAPPLVDWLGVRGALAVLGGGLVVVSFLYAVTFARVDRAAPQPSPAVEQLRGLPMFAVLPMVVVEDLAEALQENRYATGETVLVEGRPGDRYHLVVEGRAAVTVRGVQRRTLEPGEGFGEIALLRDVPRTATVVAETDLVTRSLERSIFLNAVSSSGTSRHEAEVLAEERLAEDPEADHPA